MCQYNQLSFINFLQKIKANRKWETNYRIQQCRKRLSKEKMESQVLVVSRCRAGNDRCRTRIYVVQTQMRRLRLGTVYLLFLMAIEVSQFVKQTFISVLVNSESYIEGNYAEALKLAFQKTDQLMKSQRGEKRLKQIRVQNNGQIQILDEMISDTTGCSASVVLLTKKLIITAQVGNPKIFLFKDNKPIALFENHQPESFDQKLRIQKAGGQVTEGRVNGNLKVSRAFGFHSFKQNKTLSWEEQMITCAPQIKTIERTLSDQFMVMGCEGFWSGFDKNQAEFLKKLKQKLQCQGSSQMRTFLQHTLNECVSKSVQVQNEAGTKNMTVIWVVFNQI